MNIYLNEDRRLTKNFPHQLFSKLECLVTLSLSLTYFSYALYLIWKEAFNKNIAMKEKHGEVLVCLIT